MDKIYNFNKTRSGILVTGGEPTVPKHYDDTRMLLALLDYPIANVESNGYNLEQLVKDVPGSKNIHFMYSPKIFSREDYDVAMEKTEYFMNFPNVYIKIVYEEEALIKAYCGYVSGLLKDYPGNEHKVWLMPEGVTRADLIRNSTAVFDACERYRFNFSSRSHIIYGFV